MAFHNSGATEANFQNHTDLKDLFRLDGLQLKELLCGGQRIITLDMFCKIELTGDTEKDCIYFYR